MYGDGYSGFAAWAAAKRLPPALKAIAAADAMAPGVDFPMEGHVFRNAAYRWAVANTDGREATGDAADAFWRMLDQTWYLSGKRYRDLDRLAGMPNRIFRRWLNHPSYDGYWQKMIPFRNQFARIDIPVLSMTGYYADGEVGTLYYFTQHDRYKPDADHTLLIGPYADGLTRSGPSALLRGYPVDSAALIDPKELRYQWFDHIFKGTAKPSLLKDRVNYEVMGANEWRHVPSLDAMANGSLRFYLDASASGGIPLLSRTRPSRTTVLRQTVNFADRSDAGGLPRTDILGRDLALQDAVAFVSEPLDQAIEISGLLSVHLDFKVNKMDMDLNLTLLEMLPGGDYLRLSDPYEVRASYVRDRVRRHLLKPGKRQQMKFRSEQMTSRRLQAGSRIVLVLGINKRPDREINYGAGNDVSEESVADAGIPLNVHWYSGSSIEIPVRR
jgi:putative CocE/NonD family hydrolase